MKILLILLGLAFASGAPAPAAEEHKVEKRSPDDVYLFYPSSSFRGIFGSNPRNRFGGFQRPLGGYFLELDDRRKRQVAPADAKRQKRAADFDDDDRVFFFSSPARTVSTYSSVVPRTRFVSTVQRPVGRFFIDYDDLFDDRRKRQIKPEDAKRQKRDADFDGDDDDDGVYYFTSPVTTYSAPVATYSAPVATYSAPVATYSAPVAAAAPVQTVYYVDDDDDDHDRKKRSADPDDDDDDDFRVVYTAAAAPVATTYTIAAPPVASVVYTQPRTSVQPVSYRPVSYFYDFDDKK